MIQRLIKLLVLIVEQNVLLLSFLCPRRQWSGSRNSFSAGGLRPPSPPSGALPLHPTGALAVPGPRLLRSVLPNHFLQFPCLTQEKHERFLFIIDKTKQRKNAVGALCRACPDYHQHLSAEDQIQDYLEAPTIQTLAYIGLHPGATKGTSEVLHTSYA